jgi:methyl-accepting chemotaxis protein
MKESIEKEQHDADERRVKEKKWCVSEIAKAKKILAERTHDVNELKTHIKFLEHEKDEAIKAKKSREGRIVKNEELMRKFKGQRCDNNLLFVKHLREHMEGVKVMKLLRGDIVEYFANKKKGETKANIKVNTLFLERFAEYSHLLDEEHKQVFTELSQHINKLKDINPLNKKVNEYTKEKERNAKEIGNGHVDNKRGELKKLATPGYEEAGKYNVHLEKDILKMIDDIIAHLKESREKLTKDEIKAAEDFAVFQDNTIKENAHLRRKIKKLAGEIEELGKKIHHAKEQLEKRVALQKQAEEKLHHIEKTCEEMAEYYKKETSRRNKELKIVEKATEIYHKVLSKTLERVRERANANYHGKKYNAKNVLSQHVVHTAGGETEGLGNRKKNRNQIAF